MTTLLPDRAVSEAKVVTTAKGPPPGVLGLGALTAVVIGSMIGSGVFNLPQNLAAGAGPLAIIIGWTISGIGILALAFVYQGLSTRKPELNSGPYAYAKAGFGPFVGFNSAWGYWLSAWIGNVSYAVVMFSALSYFFPPFGDGNTWQAVLGASVVLWLIHGLILSGVKQAAFANVITTIAKVAPIILLIVVVIVAFRMDVFTLDFTGLATPKLGSVLDQVKSTMLITLWVFIGIEGASVVSGRARKRKDIGIATFAGFLTTLSIYALVSLLSLGVISRPELAALKNPSMAGVLEHVVGPWGALLINIALVVSVLGAFLAWTLLAAEVPYVASRDGTTPRFFGRENKTGAPSTSLWITNGLVQLFLIVTLLANSTYLSLLYIASTAILVPYILSGAYALKLAISGEAYKPGENRARDMVLTFLGDGRDNVALSLAIGAAKVGMDMRIASPRSLWPAPEFMAQFEALAKGTGAKLTVTETVNDAVKGADFVYTDVWLSMGEDEAEWGKRIELLTPYRITSAVMAASGNPYIKFMHCLPAFHNTDTTVGADILKRFGIDCMEVTEEVFESPASIVFDQAENRMHSIKAILVATIGG